MPIISDPAAVEAIYTRAAQQGVCLANFCTANSYTTGAIIRTAGDFAAQHGLKDVPVVISATGNYPTEAQLISYTPLRSALAGLRALLNDVELLVAPDSPYANIQVLLHFDHGQPGIDDSLFEHALGRYATIMYDASAWPLDENIRMTRAFVERTRGTVLVEGAVAEIAQAEEEADIPLTDPDDAERFLDESGVFLIVPDLGTEHRATAIAARYDGDHAQKIRARVGTRMVLHGSSSLPDDHLPRLAGDGIVKVNVWTIFERLGGQAVARYVIEQLGNILPEAELRALQAQGVLGARFFEPDYANTVCGGRLSPKLDCLREEMRRDIWQTAVMERMRFYLERFNYQNWR